MGFPFKKEKKKSSKDVSNNKKKSFLGSPVRRTTPATSSDASGPSLLLSLNVVAADNKNFEVMTPDSKKAMMEQREAIRKKLFENSEQKQVDDDDSERMHRSATKKSRNTTASIMRRTAREASKEITPDGKIRDTPLDASQASIPLSEASLSFTDETETSLRKIAEESVDFAYGPNNTRTRIASAPVDLDTSYTESELASVMTKPAAVTPPRSSSQKELAPPSQTRPSNDAGRSRSAGYVVPPSDSTYNTSELGSLLTDKVSVLTDKTPSPSRKGSAAAAASPGSGGSSIPMDERSTDKRFTESLNKGKSPIKSPMPDDERAEYQSDEVQALAARLMSPVKEIGPGLTTASPPVNNNDDSYLMPENASNNSILGEMNEKSLEEATSNSPQRSGEKERQTLSEQTSVSTATQGGSTLASSHATKSTFRGPGMMAQSLISAALQCTGMSFENVAETAKDSNERGVGDDDTLISSQSDKRRPVYFDDATTLRLIRRITNNGFVLLNLQPPGALGNPTDDWSGRTVTMLINKGKATTTGGSNGTHHHQQQQQGKGIMQPPKLEWSTIAGGLAVESSTVSVNLLDIMSISKSAEVMDEDDVSSGSDEGMCFFTITTDRGDVHMFEAATLDERDRIVNGLRTVISRLAFHLIAGDTAATSELFSSHSYEVEGSQTGMEEDDDMPSLPNPSQTMNLVAHTFLDV